MLILILGIIIVVLIFLIPNLIDAGTKRRENSIRQKRKQQIKEDEQHMYEELVEKYKSSPLTEEILNYICDGDYRKKYPEWIAVTNREIRSGMQGRTFVYNFEQQRVKELENIVRWYSALDFKNSEVSDVTLNSLRVDAWKAMAMAINELMHNEYTITCGDYQAHMKLKPNKHF